MILVFHHCGQIIISNMEFLFSWVTNMYICIAQLENIPIKSSIYHQVIRGKEKTSINKLITMDCAVNIVSYLVLIFHHTPLFQLRFRTQCFEFYQIY